MATPVFDVNGHMNDHVKPTDEQREVYKIAAAANLVTLESMVGPAAMQAFSDCLHCSNGNGYRNLTKGIHAKYPVSAAYKPAAAKPAAKPAAAAVTAAAPTGDTLQAITEACKLGLITKAQAKERIAKLGA